MCIDGACLPYLLPDYFHPRHQTVQPGFDKKVQLPPQTAPRNEVSKSIGAPWTEQLGDLFRSKTSN